MSCKGQICPVADSALKCSIPDVLSISILYGDLDDVPSLCESILTTVAGCSL